MSASWFSGGERVSVDPKVAGSNPSLPGVCFHYFEKPVQYKTISKKKKDNKKKYFEGKINKAIVTRTRVGFMFAAVGASVC